MKKYNKRLSEAEDYNYQLKYYTSGIAGLKTLFYEIYQDTFGRDSDIKDFKLSVGSLKVKTDGFLFVSKIEGEQEIVLTYKNKEIIKAKLFVIVNKDKLSQVFIKGMFIHNKKSFVVNFY
jgi:hypothetical protein